MDEVNILKQVDHKNVRHWKYWIQIQHSPSTNTLITNTIILQIIHINDVYETPTKLFLVLELYVH